MELLHLLNDFERESRRVLVVEDDLELSSLIEKVLRSIDPNIDFDWATSTEGAIENLKNSLKEGSDTPYDLIVVDIFLEGSSTGIDFWNACHELFPETPVMITSALSLDKFFAIIGKQAISPPYLQKPFSLTECRQMFQSMLRYGPKEKKERYSRPHYLG